MTIQTERLLLRELDEGDAEFLFRIESSPDMVRYQLFQPRTFENAANYVREAIKAQRNDPRTYIELAVCLHSGQMIGRLGCLIQDIGARLWYVVETAEQGKGYATEAVRAFIRELWKDPSIRQLEIECDPRNTASWRLAERLGFDLVREIENSILSKGEMCSSREYVLMRA